MQHNTDKEDDLKWSWREGGKEQGTEGGRAGGKEHYKLCGDPQGGLLSPEGPPTDTQGVKIFLFLCHCSLLVHMDEGSIRQIQT